MQLVSMDLQQKVGAAPQDLLKKFVSTYREVFDELTYVPED